MLFSSSNWADLSDFLNITPWKFFREMGAWCVPPSTQIRKMNIPKTKIYVQIILSFYIIFKIVIENELKVDYVVKC